jgi:hypothetical protein
MDSFINVREGEPFVRSVFISHLEARHRILHLLVGQEDDGDIPEAQTLNRLRARIERWNDTLLGGLMRQRDVSEFSFDSQRTVDFSREFRIETRPAWGAHVWSVMISALRASLRIDNADRSPNEDLNEKIASSIVAGFGPDVFDSVGKFRTLWETRLAYAAKDTQGMIDLLLNEEDVDRGTSSTSASRVDRIPRRLDGWSEP